MHHSGDYICSAVIYDCAFSCVYKGAEPAAAFSCFRAKKRLAPAIYCSGRGIGRAADEFGAQAEESIGENRASDGLLHLFAMHMPPDEAGLRIGAKNRSGEKFLRRAQPANFVLICGGGEDV